MDISFILMLLSASTLPMLALTALMLRGNFFQGTLKLTLLVFGVLLLSFTAFDTFIETKEVFTWQDALISIGVAALTLFILSRFSHGHYHKAHEEGAKGIVISEAFHSLLDGAVIGTTYLVNPLLGYAATIGIIVHELPKIIGTITLFRGLGLTVRKTILYGITAQIGSPLAAIFIFLLGKEINDQQFHLLELSSISSIGAIVFWILYLEYKYHKKHPRHHDHKD